MTSITISIPRKVRDWIDAEIAAGHYVSVSEAIRSALVLLQGETRSVLVPPRRYESLE